MRMFESFIDGCLTKSGDLEILRTWECCGNHWTKQFLFNDLEAAAWTPVCPKCGGFDGTFFV